MPVNDAVLSFIILLYLFLMCYCSMEINDENSPERMDLKTAGFPLWCKFQPNGFNCGGISGQSRFYYDLKMQSCKTFEFGNCPTSYNNFKVLNDCFDACEDYGPVAVSSNITDNVICRLQPSFGDCHKYIPMYYFDITQRICKGFSYSGCGGNENRFESSKLCQGFCAKITDF